MDFLATVGIVSYFALMATSAWALTEGLHKGVVRGYFSRPSRREEPFDYWWSIGMWGVIFGFSLLLPGAIIFDLVGL